jgi:hypothetical protein
MHDLRRAWERGANVGSVENPPFILNNIVGSFFLFRRSVLTSYIIDFL